MNKIAETVFGFTIITLVALAYAACLTGCARVEHDGPHVVDPAAFGIPLTTVYSLGF